MRVSSGAQPRGDVPDLLSARAKGSGVVLPVASGLAGMMVGGLIGVAGGLFAAVKGVKKIVGF